MHTSNTPFNWPKARSITFALLSLGLPILALIPLPGQAIPGTSPTAPGDYRLTLAALGLSLVCAVAAVAGARRVAATASSRLSVILASGGLLLSAYLLWSLIGTCGLGVLGGTCAA